MTVGSDPDLKLPEVFSVFAQGDLGPQAALGKLGFEENEELWRGKLLEF